MRFWFQSGAKSTSAFQPETGVNGYVCGGIDDANARRHDDSGIAHAHGCGIQGGLEGGGVIGDSITHHSEGEDGIDDAGSSNVARGGGLRVLLNPGGLSGGGDAGAGNLGRCCATRSDYEQQQREQNASFQQRLRYESGTSCELPTGRKGTKLTRSLHSRSHRNDANSAFRKTESYAPRDGTSANLAIRIQNGTLTS